MELSLTIVIVVILSGVAAGTLSGLSGSREDVAATRLRSALIHAQTWASGTGRSTWVVFDTALDTATLYREDPAAPGKADRIPMLDPLTRSAMVVRIGVDGVDLISADFGATAELEFDGDGIPYDGNRSPLTTDGTVTLSGGSTLNVTRNTGLVSLN